MERRPNSKDGITKARRFPWKTTKKLGSNKEVYKNSKKSHEEIVWQKETESTRIEEKRQYVARD